MPKVKRPGNQHNSRHENGIVAPGKRITKQKSNGHLNGGADDSSKAHAVSPASSPNPSSATAVDHKTNGTPTGVTGSPQIPEVLTNDGIVDSSEGAEPCYDGLHNRKGTLDQAHKCPDGKPARNQMGSSGGNILHLAFTILRACPVGDTIAILLVLLWLPPTLLTITNALFAVLTFMPQTLALPSFPPTINDIFLGTGNTPSLATIFITDVIGLILWLVMWAPFQALAIELAQAVIATTLGGGSASRRRGSEISLLCVGLVTINHVTRHDWFPQHIFGFDWSAILSSIPYLSGGISLGAAEDDDSSTRSPAGWIRVVVALHILIQGLVRVLRRWYQKREYAQGVAISKKADAEAGAGPPTRSSSMSNHDVGSATHPPNAGDGSGRTAISKETRDRILTGKKKRKQGTVVRSQQPLWAAFAATKLTVLREYEQSQALKEVVEAKAVDQKNLGSVPFAHESDRVWISDLGPHSFKFYTTLLPQVALPDNQLSEDETGPSAQVSAALQVRINNTNWTSVRIVRGEKSSNGKEEWNGEVFGLTPASSYRCNFVQGKGSVALYSLTVTTPPLLPLDGETSSTSADVSQRPYQPSSPTSPKTTLKRSIAAFEASLNETQARQKKNKKENKNALAGLKKDIDVLNAKINKLGGEDKAHMNRQMQWNQHTRQADEAVASIADELESLDALPEDESKMSQEIKTSWEDVKGLHAAAREEMMQAKDAASRERSAVQAEVTVSQQKRERLLARRNKLGEQLSRLEAATASGLDAKERKNSEQAAREVERAQIEQRDAEQLSNFLQAYQQSQLFVQQASQQIQMLESAFQEQQMRNSLPPAGERPLTPEGDLPGTNPQNHTPAGFRFPAFGSPDAPIMGFRSDSASLRRSDTRPRSTSGVSGNSVYADFEDQDPAPPMPTRAVKAIREKGRQHSGSGGSGSASSGSHPASPLVGSAAQASPVGKRSPVWNS